jgi:hypothetical protein
MSAAAPEPLRSIQLLRAPTIKPEWARRSPTPHKWQHLVQTKTHQACWLLLNPAHANIPNLRSFILQKKPSLDKQLPHSRAQQVNWNLAIALIITVKSLRFPRSITSSTSPQTLTKICVTRRNSKRYYIESSEQASYQTHWKNKKRQSGTQHDYRWRDQKTNKTGDGT